MSFSPCHSRIRNKYEFFSSLLSRAVDPVPGKRLQPPRYGSSLSAMYAEE
jgi:hypothetical protein